ncbi:MAG: nucleotidyltransferase domain-containing protein [Henriciella sp.]|uniref:nucleotidyltransferase domain-containing protein n=1 Tax=Henriciella sp. TaxID=1968823 RepID=UPI0032EB9C1F
MSGLDVIPADALQGIRKRLERVKAEHDARILLAVESGSRAWGFPSPDSDFDVRFIYVLPKRAYLGLEQPRDVIEQPIEGLYDINGWDLRKALNLLLKANPAIAEWLRSPIVYEEAPGFREEIEALLALIDERPAAQHHHLSTLRSAYTRQIQGQGSVRLKKYFYCLRPAYALHWMWENADGQLPMVFSELRRGVREPADRAEEIDRLLSLKASTRDLGAGDPLPMLDSFLEATIAKAESLDLGHQKKPVPSVRAACESLLLRTLEA